MLCDTLSPVPDLWVDLERVSSSTTHYEWYFVLYMPTHEKRSFATTGTPFGVRDRIWLNPLFSFFGACTTGTFVEYTRWCHASCIQYNSRKISLELETLLSIFAPSNVCLNENGRTLKVIPGGLRRTRHCWRVWWALGSPTVRCFIVPLRMWPILLLLLLLYYSYFCLVPGIYFQSLYFLRKNQSTTGVSVTLGVAPLCLMGLVQRRYLPSDGDGGDTHTASSFSGVRDHV